MRAEHKREIGRIPADVYNKLLPYNGREQAEKILAIPPDFAHAKYHVNQVRLYCQILGRRLLEAGLIDQNELDRLDIAAQHHDSGNGFVSLGILEPSEHHIGSWFLLKRLGYDDQTAWLALVHSKDDIPHTMEYLSANVLNIADRVAGTGWTGALRCAYYRGVSHPVFDNPDENEHLIVDMRPPREVVLDTNPDSPDYEANVKEFFISEIFPLVDKLNIRDQLLVTDMLLWARRFDGMVGKRYQAQGSEPQFMSSNPLFLTVAIEFELKLLNTFEVSLLMADGT